MAVELTEVTADNVGDVYELAVGPGQGEFVAPNPWSLAQAYAERDIAWPRAVVADGAIVGFIMLQFDPDDDEGRPFQLWRLMIAADHQGKGYGRAAVSLGVEECRRRGPYEARDTRGDEAPAPSDTWHYASASSRYHNTFVPLKGRYANPNAVD